MAKPIDTRRHRAALPVFTPSAVSAESLALRTVGREAEIERLVCAIRTAAMTDNRPHQLIVGPRGSGKSHLLIVALHEALTDKQISDRVAVAMLPEDAVEIAGYEDLLVSVVDRTPGGAEARREAARDLRVRRDVAGLEQLVLEQLGDRVLALVVENLDRVFRDLGDVGQARLRNLTETSGRVLLLASTPLLFDAVSDHARPWYGSFHVEHLRELDAEQGRDLLRRIAKASGDQALAASLDSPKGLARVRAVEHLAGGSPRMWTVLAGCITLELLDELVPLVEALFDELAPYYQQRLWELAGVERKLVYELCWSPAATVKDLARAAGLSERAAATSLGRLHDARWVRREKRAGADRRTTWYSLREPLLRHHVEYRETGVERLPALVGFLRSWYEAEELAEHLASVSPASLAEAYVVAALPRDDNPAWRGAWPSVASVDDLITAARCWLAQPSEGGLGSFTVGLIAEAVALGVKEGGPAGREAAAARLDRRAGELLLVVDAALAAADFVRDPILSIRDPTLSCARGLYAAGEPECGLPLRDRIALGLLAGAMGVTRTPSPEWWARHARTVNRLPASEDRLRLIFRASHALSGWGSQPSLALANATRVLAACARRLGPSDWTTRSVVYNCVPLSLVASGLAGRQNCAETVTLLMDRADLATELSALLLSTYFASSALRPGREVSIDWLATWADATSASVGLDRIHHFLRVAAVDDPLSRSDLSAEERDHMGSLLTTVSDVLTAAS